jgi:hypothetical protein
VRRRTIVAFQQVEGPQARLMRDMVGGPGTVTDEQRRKPPGLGRYWCAADRPQEDDADFRIAPVYRTHKVAEDARCEECGIAIRELQEMLGPAASTEGQGSSTPLASGP